MVAPIGVVGWLRGKGWLWAASHCDWSLCAGQRFGEASGFGYGLGQQCVDKLQDNLHATLPRDHAPRLCTQATAVAVPTQSRCQQREGAMCGGCQGICDTPIRRRRSEPRARELRGAEDLFSRAPRAYVPRGQCHRSWQGTTTPWWPYAVPARRLLRRRALQEPRALLTPAGSHSGAGCLRPVGELDRAPCGAREAAAAGHSGCHSSGSPRAPQQQTMAAGSS